MPETRSPSAFRTYLWWILSAVSLLAGYADLWRGGDTLAPILLVLGYCVFIPVAIMSRGPDDAVARTSGGRASR